MRSWCCQLVISYGSIYVKCFNYVESEPRKLIMRNVKLLWKGNDLDLLYLIYLEISFFFFLCFILREMTAH